MKIGLLKLFSERIENNKVIYLKSKPAVLTTLIY